MVVPILNFDSKMYLFHVLNVYRRFIIDSYLYSGTEYIFVGNLDYLRSYKSTTRLLNLAKKCYTLINCTHSF
uniref:Uncharacterized protein n=1 Tax=Pararge aegeria TaxID=116150 RepID=S4PFA6_9NEOP